MEPLTLWTYKQHDLSEDLDVNLALLVLSERLNTATNVIRSLDREIERIKSIENDFETYKAEQESLKARRLMILKDLL